MRSELITLRRPLVTEKVTKLQEDLNQYVFRSDLRVGDLSVLEPVIFLEYQCFHGTLLMLASSGQTGPYLSRSDPATWQRS